VNDGNTVHAEAVMEFPERQWDVMVLALLILRDLGQHPEEYGSPPVPPDELRARIRRVSDAIAACAAAETAVRETHDAKELWLVELKELLDANLWCVEIDVRGRPERLTGLGWGGRPGATDREPPGRVREMAVRSQGDTWVVLEWRPPVDGGPAVGYGVERRKPCGEWKDVAIALGNDCLLVDQPSSIELDYRVIAVNRAGDGPPSAIVTVVL
jgi:hypothetical protein